MLEPSLHNWLTSSQQAAKWAIRSTMRSVADDRPPFGLGPFRPDGTQQSSRSLHVPGLRLGSSKRHIASSEICFLSRAPTLLRPDNPARPPRLYGFRPRPPEPIVSAIDPLTRTFATLLGCFDMQRLIGSKFPDVRRPILLKPAHHVSRSMLGNIFRQRARSPRMQSPDGPDGRKPQSCSSSRLYPFVRRP